MTTKDQTYITAEHKEIIRNFLILGEEDKDKEKSAALMVEAIKLEIKFRGIHPRQKYYVPDIFEITQVNWFIIKHTKKIVNVEEVK